VTVVTQKTLKLLDERDEELFLLVLNSITSAAHFLEHLVTLYDLEIDEARLAAAGCAKSSGDVAFAICRLLEQWMKKRVSRRVLDLIRQFATRALTEPRGADRQLAGVLKKLKNPQQQTFEVSGLSPPVIPRTDSLLSAIVGLFDPEPIEVARQISLICHEKFASIHPLEFITAMSNGSTTVRTSTLTEFFEFGDGLTLLVTDACLNAPN
jgi:hypothetical protein